MKGLIVYLLDHRNEFNLWRGVSDVFLCPGQRWGKEKRNKSIFRVTSRMVVFPDSRAQVRRVVSSLKREVYHLTEAPNGGHIQHPSSHLGAEFIDHDFLLEVTNAWPAIPSLITARRPV